MTYEEADELIREHIDYGGSLDIHALAVAISSASAVDARALTLNQWIDIASRHANRDWNGGGYLESVKALCADYARAALSASTEAAPINGIPATYSHDEGAIARCSYCGRYSLDPKTLSDRQPMCDCGEKHGWSGSFERPGVDAKWSGAAPPAASGQKLAEIIDWIIGMSTDAPITNMARRARELLTEPNTTPQPATLSTESVHNPVDMTDRVSQVAIVVKDVIETLMLWNGQASAGLDVNGLAGLRDEVAAIAAKENTNV